MLLDEPPADLLRQVGERQRRQCRPGRGPDPAVAVAGSVRSGCASRPRATSRKRPRRSSQKRSTILGVIEGSPAAILARPQSTFVTTSQSTGPPAPITRRASQPRRRFLAIRKGKSGRACARRPQTASNFGDESRPDSSGWRIQSSPSPSSSRFASSQRWWAAIRGSSAGSPTAMRQAQASSGGWIVEVLGAVFEATLYVQRRCQSTWPCQKIVCPMKPSSDPPASRLRSSLGRGRDRSGARRSRGSTSPSTTATGSGPGSAA